MINKTTYNDKHRHYTSNFKEIGFLVFRKMIELKVVFNTVHNVTTAFSFLSDQISFVNKTISDSNNNGNFL
jgi:hypothetical protein